MRAILEATLEALQRKRRQARASDTVGPTDVARLLGRVALTQYLKSQMLSNRGDGLTLEGMGIVDTRAGR